MPQPIRHTITRLEDGKYKVVRFKSSGGVSEPLGLDRSELEKYLTEGKIVGRTLEDVMSELDRTGKADIFLKE